MSKYHALRGGVPLNRPLKKNTELRIRTHVHRVQILGPEEICKKSQKNVAFRKNSLTFLLGGDRHSDLESLLLRSETLDSECYHDVF